MSTRSGFIGLAGRPNVGKSTLVNALVGSHVAIVSVRPQTTRRAIRGVATDLEAERQLVLVDLPGVQRPRDALTKRMQKRVERELADSDVALLVINGEEGVGPGDRFIAGLLKAARIEIPVICAVNKCDKIARRGTIDALTEAASLPAVDEVFPISAQTGEGLEALLHRLGELIPEGPYMYPPEDSSDQSSELLLAELIREQVLNRTRQEIPHSVEVSVLEVSEPREDDLVTVTAEIWAETESAPPPGARSNASSSARSTSTSASACAATGGATRTCSIASASSRAARPLRSLRCWTKSLSMSAAWCPWWCRTRHPPRS
jgi:GTP-binding protein Era